MTPRTKRILAAGAIAIAGTTVYADPAKLRSVDAGDVIAGEAIVERRTDGTVEEVVQYSYLAPLPERPQGIGEKYDTEIARSAKSRTFMAPDGEKQTVIYSALPAVYRDPEGQWWSREYATATPLMFGLFEKAPEYTPETRVRDEKPKEATSTPRLSFVNFAYAQFSTSSDTGSGLASVDGGIDCPDANQTANNIAGCKSATSGNVLTNGVTLMGSDGWGLTGYLERGAGVSNKHLLIRSFLTFDTSSIPDTDTVASGTIAVYLWAKTDGMNDAYSYMTFVESTQAADDDLASTDYDNFNTTPLTSNEDITGLDTSSYNHWVLNATGLAFIDKTGVTPFALIEGHDLENQNWTGGSTGSYINAYAADQGSAERPILTLTHSAGGGGATPAPPSHSVIWFD